MLAGPALLLAGDGGLPPCPRLMRPSVTQLPWKSLTSIVEYYYMWKTTDRYVQQVGSLGWAGRGSGGVGHPRALLLCVADPA